MGVTWRRENGLLVRKKADRNARESPFVAEIQSLKEVSIGSKVWRKKAGSLLRRAPPPEKRELKGFGGGRGFDRVLGEKGGGSRFKGGESTETAVRHPIGSGVHIAIRGGIGKEGMFAIDARGEVQTAPDGRPYPLKKRENLWGGGFDILCRKRVTRWTGIVVLKH